MKRALVLVVIIACLGAALYMGTTMRAAKSPPPVTEQTQSVYQKMDVLSEDVYRLAKEGKYNEAKKQLAELGVLVASAKPPRGLSLEAVNALTDTVVKAKRAFAAVEAEPNRLIWHALQVRLTIDSLTHESEPLWKNYYNSYQEHVNKMMLLVASRKQNEFARAFTQNLQLYQTLKPAMSIHTPVQNMESLYSIYSFLIQETRKQEYNWDGITNALEELNRQTQIIFLGKEQPTFGLGIPPQSPILIIALFASCIVSGLGYFAWKKYRAENEGRKREQDS